MTLAIVLCVGSLNAQVFNQAAASKSLEVVQPTTPKSIDLSTQVRSSGKPANEFPVSIASRSTSTSNRAIIYSEGFEGTSGTNLPTGWTKTAGVNWITIATGQSFPGVQDIFAAYAGTRSMGRSWQRAGDTWAYSAGFALVGGESYTVSFYFSAPGYEEAGVMEYDDFEVKIGTGQTAGDMTHTIFSHINTETYEWTLAQGTFTPTTSGTYYLGFHDLTPAQSGIWIAIDDIKVEGADAPPACDPATITDVTLEGSGNRINWTLPGKRDVITLTQAGARGNNVVGAGTASFGFYHRFTPAELAAIGADNATLNQVLFCPATSGTQPLPSHNYKIQIYQGGSWTDAPGAGRNPGTLVCEQEITLTGDDYNNPDPMAIILNNPVTINASQELWIGLFATNFLAAGGSPALSDVGPRNDNFGNLMFFNNAWSTLTELLATANYNWYIQAKATTDGPVTETINLFHNDNLIASEVSGTTYLHANPIGALHCYKVQVNCLEGGNSAMSNEVCISTPDDCQPATITEVTAAGNGMYVAWNYAAKKAEVTITQSGGPGTTVIGSGTNPNNSGAYHRFRPEDLVAVKGGVLNKIVFVAALGDAQDGVPKHTYTLRVYKGGTWSETPGSGRNPGTLVSEQLLDNDDLDFEYGEDNIITLNTPVTITGTEEIWIGTQAIPIPGMTGPAYPLLVDAAPAPFKDHLGNIMLSGSSWRTLNEAISGGFTRNWYLQGKVQYTPPTVNIYRNNVVIKSNYEGTSLVDPTLSPGNYCYKLTVNCSNGDISDFSNEKCDEIVSIKDNIKEGFSIAPNPTTGNVKITAGDHFHTIEVVNFLGQTVISQPNAGDEATLDVSTLTNGVYFVRIISENGTSVKKFVKQ